MNEPWYKDGLRFECTRCGACCTGAPGFVWVNDDEILKIASFLALGELDFGERFLRRLARGTSLVEHANGDCVFYDREARGCRIYPVRPRQCRSWPFWESNIETADAWKATCEICPGAGRGDFVSRDDIVRRASLIAL
jgi:Fe-S-cluster containining protein